MTVQSIAETIARAASAFFEGIIHVWEAEPVAVTGLVTVLIDAGVAFGLPITPEQKLAVVGVVSALGVLIARSQVTPVAGQS